ncbi:MAG: DNA-deoxyinosine glycosylase [Granulosicoccus sp.]|nr:DNA-deoxyinosine glycosylase [Granulosicoccus sp.]
MIRAFDPVEPVQASLLILGSMPGVASLNANHYYAHPRNAFWPIMQHLFGRQWENYDAGIALLKHHQVALWDVLRECRRPGSLDAHIIKDSVVVNDFTGFLQRHPALTTIAFNGKAAEKLFRQHVVKPAKEPLLSRLNNLSLLSLPSSSPAMASLSLDAKKATWEQLLAPALMPVRTPAPKKRKQCVE